MVKGKRAILGLARSGVYSNGPAKSFDFQEPYLCTVLGFIGITNVQAVHVEGVGAVSDELIDELLAADVMTLSDDGCDFHNRFYCGLIDFLVVNLF
ncbi:MAG TPA: NAD(P)H-dependent oxidoreductase [Verrucomicrobiae bacterium]|nr:NAD(P)H-dependent oxidoreductase [Verrucomicrobiae bacterium]